ncbi:MAG: hypothetical protein L0G22_11785 [Propionibacteriaceae bacterium]|nr:hypothetical protein [Propionibacteriaceae bacterium]
MSTEQFDQRAEPTREQASEDPTVRHPHDLHDPTGRSELDDLHPDTGSAGVGERHDPPGDEHGEETTDRHSANIADEVTPD